MLRYLRCCAVLGALALLAVPAFAQGRSEYIQDDAGLFSKEAKNQAQAEMVKIRNRFKKEFVVDTVASVKLPSEINPKDGKAVDRFVTEWAGKRFTNEKIDGVYVVIIDNLKKFRIRNGIATETRGIFDNDDEKALQALIQNNLKDGKKDQALTGAAKLVYDRMAENAPTVIASKDRPQPAPTPKAAKQENEIPWGRYLLIGLGVIAGLWLLSAVIRGFTGGGGGSGGPGGGPGGGGGGGGGFMSNFLGGLVGAAAGMYLYNSFFGGHNTAYGADHSGGATGTGADGASGADTGSTDAGGGDWGGGDAGGGDAGGGDMGGGDAGGGDWGGGGGDWGGGGDMGGGGGDW